MKPFLLLMLTVLAITDLKAQSADELWQTLQERYQSLSDYSDEGIYIRVSHSTASVSSFKVSTAIDRHMRIRHEFASSEEQNAPYEVYKSYLYVKHANEATGMFIRDLGTPDTSFATADIACARLYGVGGGILHMVSALMFPNLYPEASFPELFPHDTLIRRRDTLFNQQDVRVLEMQYTRWVSSEEIQRGTERRDSILGTKRLPAIFYTSLPEQHPHNTMYITKYFIRKSDGLICGRTVDVFNSNVPSYSSTLILMPRADF